MLTARVTVSAALPAGEGTTMRIGLVGYCWARAVSGAASSEANANAVPAERCMDRRLMVFPLDEVLAILIGADYGCLDYPRH